MSEKSTLLPPVSRRLKHATSRRLQSLRRGEREDLNGLVHVPRRIRTEIGDCHVL